MPSGNEGSQSGLLGRFEFIPVLSGEPEDSDWQAPRRFASERVRSVLGDRIADHHVDMCAPLAMLDATEKTELGAGGLPRTSTPRNFYDRSHTQPRG